MIQVTDQMRLELGSLLAQYPSTELLVELKASFQKPSIDLRSTVEAGLQFLPPLRDETGNQSLECLDEFSPQAVGFYELLGRLSFLPETVSDLCTELSSYANGSSVELNAELFALEPTVAVEQVFAA